MGTRPEAIKLAPVIHALSQAEDFQPVVVATGQHEGMLASVVSRFNLPIDHQLDVMRPDQTLSGLTARLLDAIDPVLEAESPDITLVQGDTTSVLAGALASFYRGIPVGHVEAGLRTGQMMAPFPEEANRLLATRLSHLHFAPTQRAQDQLLEEHVDPATVFITGNTVIDALKMELARQSQESEDKSVRAQLEDQLGPNWNAHPFVLITGHRRESFGPGFEEICGAIAELAGRYPHLRFIYPVHLNPNVREPVQRILSGVENVRLIEPTPYGPFVALLNACHLILTDSGGVQEEAPSLGKPVLVMRETTERPEGIEAGTVRLVGTSQERIVDEVSRLISDQDAYLEMAEAANPYGDGKASDRILEALRDFFKGRVPRAW
ncbi:MAG: UDP-N-acetylglucosamine 2-epimerase (non-hydrolyzing) [Myxococcota bacterium]|nr:UDP-N-acetylglucosamine 2-epimerase (non-hydrolyzing) [Myxococcota bacterium]